MSQFNQQAAQQAAPMSTALVVARPKAALVSITEIMGSDISTIFVGKANQKFAVHTGLLLEAGGDFKTIFAHLPPPGKNVTFSDDEPAIFKLMNDYLYTRVVPSVRNCTTNELRATRLKDLCRLYVFASKYYLNFSLRNQIMDNIQDGFLAVDAFPQAQLVGAIYDNTTQPINPLRKFGIACLVHHIRTPGKKSIDSNALITMLNTKPAALVDFLEEVQNFTPGQDPRLRDCKGEKACVECHGREGRLDGLSGVKPCYFHVHEETDEQGVKTTDPACHFWDVSLVKGHV